MRIAHVTATYPPYKGGTGNVCYHNARELVMRGHEVHVFTAAVPDAPRDELQDGINVHRLRPIVRVGNAPLLPQLLATLRGFDVIHLHYPFILGAELVRLASLLYHTPVILSLHNDLIGDGARARLFSVYQKLSARFTVRHVSTLGAVSLDHYEHSRLRLDLEGHEPSVVELPNGVDVELFHPLVGSNVRERYGISEDAFLVLFVAALDRAHHFKGLGHLLHAISQLPGGVWLLVVGDGELRSGYERQADSLGIAGRSVFAGAVDHAETPPYYRSADITVLPSSPPESFGLVLIESMACGTPVVASALPGVRTVVADGENGFLAEPGSPEALAAQLGRLLSLSPARREAMGAAGRRKVEQRYAWNRIGDQLDELYHQVAGRQRTTAAEATS